MNTAPLAWQVGGVDVVRVEETITDLDPRAIMPDCTDAHVAQCSSWLQPAFFTDDGLVRLSIHSFVVVSQGVTIVVDTCVGTDPERALPADPAFLDRLAAACPGGLGGVDVVLCTHLHFDHVGWNTRVVDDERVPTFPNARYLFAQAELDHLALDDHMDVSEAAVQPLLDRGLVDPVPTDHQITSEVSLVSTPGHTPGHVAVRIASQGAEALITGDATHSPLQFSFPELAASRFDWDSEMSTQTRHDLVKRCVDRDILVLGTHFAPPTSGYVRNSDTGVAFVSHHTS